MNFFSLSFNQILVIMKNAVTRFSDEDLKEFRALIEKKLTKAREQLQQLQEQILEIAEKADSGYDLDDSSSNFSEKEFLQDMAYRQKKHVRDLDNALLRINNRTYGVCQVSGELIDKKRLLAVPTTTKSIQAKLSKPAVKPVVEKPEGLKRTRKQVVISKVVRKFDVPPSPLSESFDDWGGEEEEDISDGWKYLPLDENEEE